MTTPIEASHDHPAFLAHHFETPRQQFEAGKLGMWIFLVTEVLFFSGLFCAYAVYRANHPEIFVYAHQFLDKTYGAINTGVLIFSSLTMAWAVRAAQLNQRGVLVGCLAFTLLCAAAFMGIKSVEYSHKWHDGLLWAGWYDPNPQHLPVAPHEPGEPASATEHGHGEQPRNVGLFFSIYFAMTGLHAIHVLAGMGVITWIMVRAARGAFTPEYYGPVDFTALYWHLVDLIWIFLFPLLYLIH